jgi:hypothetical protein
MNKLDNKFKISLVLILAIVSLGLTLSIDAKAQKDCAALINNNTKIGKQNNDVLQLQKCLRQAGAFTYPQDTGYYGVLTDKALKDYLAKPKIVAPDVKYKDSCLSFVTPNTYFGAQHQDVANLQKCLRYEKYFTYPTDTGYFGNLTKTALDSYKASLKPVDLSYKGTARGGMPFTDRLNAFYTKYQNQRVADPRGYSHGECVSLAKQWQDYIGASYGIWPGDYPHTALRAFDNGNYAMAPDNDKYTVFNVTHIYDLEPGDIVITHPKYGYSHTGIATGNNVLGSQKIEIIEQNSPAGSGVVQIRSIEVPEIYGALRYIKR